jgi:hypothetical protein
MSDLQASGESLLLALQLWKGRCLQVETTLVPAGESDRHRQLRTCFQMTLAEALPVTSGCKLLLLGEGPVELEFFLDRIEHIEQGESQINWTERLDGNWMRCVLLSLVNAENSSK